MYAKLCQLGRLVPRNKFAHKVKEVFYMSFYINNTNPNRPGPMVGNPLNGICEKVMIETTKVFDACVTQSTETGIILPITDQNPPNPTLPLTYVSAQNTEGESVVVSDLVIDRIESSPNYANVSMTITIPVTVTYRDANGVLGTGTSTITVKKNVMLFVPQPALTPVNITATGLFASTIGAYTAENVFTVTGCIQIMIKVTSVVDILVPSYGYPVVPPCQAAPESNSCQVLGNMPLYPTAAGPNVPRV